MHPFTNVMQPQKCSVKWLCHGADVTEWQHTNLEGLASYIPNLSFFLLFFIIIIITINNIILLRTWTNHYHGPKKDQNCNITVVHPHILSHCEIFTGNNCIVLSSPSTVSFRIIPLGLSGAFVQLTKKKYMCEVHSRRQWWNLLYNKYVRW